MCISLAINSFQKILFLCARADIMLFSYYLFCPRKCEFPNFTYKERFNSSCTLSPRYCCPKSFSDLQCFSSRIEKRIPRPLNCLTCPLLSQTCPPKRVNVIFDIFATKNAQSRHLSWEMATLVNKMFILDHHFASFVGCGENA